MTSKEQESIKKTQSGFENSFAEGEFYNRQTQDEQHLKLLLELADAKPGMKILDLGCGSGYFTFALAKACPEAVITGLDIVENALAENRKMAENKGLHNVKFVAYDGITFPFEEESFDLIVTRYALHHFPAIRQTFAQIERVLKKGGRFLISDPTPNENDETERFVDDYMQMKKDGHIKFYTVEEFKQLAGEVSMEPLQTVMTSIRFPKKRKDAAEFDSIMDRHTREVTDGYDLVLTEEEIFITERVQNIVFEKQ